MLTLEYLIEEARHNGLPASKTRGILREYLQVVILSYIFRSETANAMLFTGGTALRHFYALPRFSEDLDFDSSGLTLKQLNHILDFVQAGLKKEGFAAEIRSEARGRLLLAELRFRDIGTLYRLTDRRGLDLMIKLDVYLPKWKLEAESGVLSLYGYNFSAVLLDRAYLFAEKICALLNRGRGRDIYDTLFMLRRKFPVKEEVLAANGMKGSPKQLVLDRLSRFSKKELKFLSDQVKPFLFKEDDIELVLHADQYARRFLEEVT